MNQPAPETPTPAETSPQPARPPRKSNKLLLAVAAFLCAGIVAGSLVISIGMPGPLSASKRIVIPRGASVREIGAKLREDGVIFNPLMFRLASRVLANDSLHAGEYEFKAGQNMADVVLVLKEGRSVVRLFTAPEGLTSRDIVAALRNEIAFSGDISSLPDEGSLLPETYHYTYGDSRAGLIERMQKSRRDLLKELWEGREVGLPLFSPEESVVVASIIEKETGKKEERARVAGVIYNRLRKGMRLQSDPTVIYGMTRGGQALARPLSHNDLAFASPYNTYTNDGLPPKPICNPGRASIEAALHPEKHDFLYFVADGTSGHAFARTLEEHNRNVTRWQSLLKP